MRSRRYPEVPGHVCRLAVGTGRSGARYTPRPVGRAGFAVRRGLADVRLDPIAAGLVTDDVVMRIHACAWTSTVPDVGGLIVMDPSLVVDAVAPIVVT